MLPSLSVVKASSGEDHLCVSELLVGSFAFGVHAMNFMVPSFAYEVRTTWCILGLLGRVRSAAREWLAWAMNPVGGGVGLGLHVSAGHKTNSVSWLASLTPPFNKS
ncbi:hypothetical protein WN944_013010 [Citrus x changshan-huyou]|uniref:Uncharacterized protein n=1 Tax=Citrus x changshan-huyou TaxID=2935761 RepID=A0AAP0QNM1_9ROSI